MNSISSNIRKEPVVQNPSLSDVKLRTQPKLSTHDINIFAAIIQRHGVNSAERDRIDPPGRDEMDFSAGEDKIDSPATVHKVEVTQ